MSKKLAWAVAIFAAFIISLLFVFILFFGYKAYQNSQPRSTITVQGNASQELSYDSASITYFIQTKGLNSEVANLNQENDQKTQTIVDYLTTQGIPTEDIKTNKNTYQDYSFPFNQNPNEEQRIVVDSSIEVQFANVQSDIEKPNEITQELTNLGVTNFSNFNYSISNEEEICEDLKIQAIQDATEKVEKRIEALGGEKIIKKNVSEFNGCGQDFYRYDDFPLAASTELESDAQIKPAPVLTGTQEISVSIDLIAEYR